MTQLIQSLFSHWQSSQYQTVVIDQYQTVVIECMHAVIDLAKCQEEPEITVFFSLFFS
jgi:hypothetical protein